MTQVSEAMLASPVILTGRGGSGTRLFSVALQRLGIFLGNALNQTEDSIEWVQPLYRIAVASLTGDPGGQGRWNDELRANARAILGAKTAEGDAWGWKLPETVLILPQVLDAFPNARVIHVIRHPLDVCLRRSHMTSRTGNPIGDAVLAAAYARLGWTSDPRSDPEHLRNAASWRFQLERALAFSATEHRRVLEVRYEAMCDSPQRMLQVLAGFLGVAPVPAMDGVQIDPERRRRWTPEDPRAGEVWEICGPIADRLGYRFPLRSDGTDA